MTDDDENLKAQRRAEMIGTLDALSQLVAGAQIRAAGIDELVLSDELDQVGEWMSYLMDRLIGGKEVKPWNGIPVPLSGPPIALIRQWLGPINALVMGTKKLD